MSVDAAWRSLANQQIPNPFNKNGKPPWRARPTRSPSPSAGSSRSRSTSRSRTGRSIPGPRRARKILLAKAAMFKAGPRELAWALSGSRLEKLFEFLGMTAAALFGIDGNFLGNLANGADRCENHAERKVVRHADPPKNALLSVGASRAICPTCYGVLKDKVLYYGGWHWSARRPARLRAEVIR